MFSDHIKKAVPHKLDDCIKPDNVSTNLWTWCERLENWGKILFIIILICGIIATISTAVETYQLFDEFSGYSERMLLEYGIELPSLFESICLSLLRWALYAFLEYCAYHVLALLIGALATITQNSAITANIALYNTSQTGNAADKKEAPGAFSNVTAPQNTPSEIRKNNVSKKTAPLSSFDHKESWVCNSCGKENAGFYLRCQGCGNFR